MVLSTYGVLKNVVVVVLAYVSVFIIHVSLN